MESLEEDLDVDLADILDEAIELIAAFDEEESPTSMSVLLANGIRQDRQSTP